MKLIYLGAEVPSNRTLLETTSVTQVGVSFWRLRERGLPKNKDYLLENYFNEDYAIYVYPGIPKGTKLSSDELAAFAAEYEDFIANNIDRLTTFNEISEVDPAFVELQRKTAWAEVPPGKFQPVWDPESGLKGLNLLVDNYLDIAIPGYAIEEQTQLAVGQRQCARPVPILSKAELVADGQLAVLASLIPEHLRIRLMACFMHGLKNGQSDTDIDAAVGRAMLGAHNFLAGLVHLLE